MIFLGKKPYHQTGAVRSDTQSLRIHLHCPGHRRDRNATVADTVRSRDWHYADSGILVVGILARAGIAAKHGWRDVYCGRAGVLVWR